MYCRVYWEITSADPFTQAQLKELTLARGFKPGFHGATTLPMYSHLTRGGYACPLALSRVLAGLVLRAQLVRCFQSLSGRCTLLHAPVGLPCTLCWSPAAFDATASALCLQRAMTPQDSALFRVVGAC